jgi:single-strand DNA-binding protein
VLPVVTMEGTVVADPELRFAPSGTAVGKLRLAANSRKLNKETNQWEDDKSLFLSVTYFGAMAEHVAESLRKGDLATATGKLQTESWETEAGEKRSMIVMIADSVGVALRFRTIPHGEQKRVERSSTPPADDAWTAPNAAEDPPF